MSVKHPPLRIGRRVGKSALRTPHLWLGCSFCCWVAWPRLKTKECCCSQTPTGAKDCTPAIDTSEIIFDCLWHSPVFVQWHFPNNNTCQGYVPKDTAKSQTKKPADCNHYNCNRTTVDEFRKTLAEFTLMFAHGLTSNCGYGCSGYGPPVV